MKKYQQKFQRRRNTDVGDQAWAPKLSPNDMRKSPHYRLAPIPETGEVRSVEPTSLKQTIDFSKFDSQKNSMLYWQRKRACLSFFSWKGALFCFVGSCVFGRPCFKQIPHLILAMCWSSMSRCLVKSEGASAPSGIDNVASSTRDACSWASSCVNDFFMS